jgi:hypothetical protein
VAGFLSTLRSTLRSLIRMSRRSLVINCVLWIAKVGSALHFFLGLVA